MCQTAPHLIPLKYARPEPPKKNGGLAMPVFKENNITVCVQNDLVRSGKVLNVANLLNDIVDGSIKLKIKTTGQRHCLHA